MGKKRTNALQPQYMPRAPQTALDFIANGDVKFEELCCDLMAVEPGIADAYRYGRDRQRQFGIDVYAERSDESGIEVASCKCYREVRSKGQIAAWSEDFLKHWDTKWRLENVRRFVLCVACNLNSHERREEIEEERTRFKRHGVKYEVWTQSKLTRMLRDRTDIRDVYFQVQYDSAVGARISAETKSDGPNGAAFLTAAMVNQLAETQKLLSQAVNVRLDELRAALQTGRHAGIETALSGILADERTWDSLDATVQARVLRMQATLLMQSDKMAAALSLIERAEMLAPEEERRVRAVWIARTESAAAALSVLGEPKTQDGALLRVALYIEMEKLAEALSALTQDPLIANHDAEWHRLSACAAFHAADRESALEHCVQAEALSPDNVAVLEIGAVIRYGLTLSSASNFWFTDGPVASQVDFALIDDLSQGYAKKALEMFERLGERAATPFQKNRATMWRLACLAVMPDRANEVRAECLRLISSHPPVGTAVIWGLARGIEFDREEVERRLRQQLDTTPASMDSFQALIVLCVLRGERGRVLEVLRHYEAGFTEPLERRHIERLAKQFGRPRRPSTEADVDPYNEVLSLVKTKWAGQQARAIDEYLTGRKPAANVVMVGCLILASHSEWRHIVPHVDRLLAEVANAEAVRLSVYARYNTSDYSGALAVLEHASDKFPGRKLPADLLRIQALSAGHEGKFEQALPLAHELAGSTGRPGDRLLYSELAVRSGNIAHAVPFIRELHESGAVPGGRLLAFIPSVATTDQALARSLLAHVTQSDLPMEVGGTLLDWHYRLGMEQQAHVLMQRLIALKPNRKNGKKGPLRSIPMSEIGKYIRQQQKLRADLDEQLRQDGAPIHVVASVLGANLAEVWERAFTDRDTGLLIRSANRPILARLEKAPRSLALDITAVLTLEQLGLADTLLGSSLELELPSSLMEVLNGLEQRLPHHQPARLGTMQNVVDVVASGGVKVWNEGTVLPEKTLKVVFETDRAQSTLGRKKKMQTSRGPGRTTANIQPNQGAPSSVPAHVTAQVQLGSIGAELARSGRLSPEGLTQLRADHADWRGGGLQGAEIEIEQSQALLFEANTIESVFRIQLQETVAQRWQLWMEEEYLSRIQTELADSRAAQSFADRIKRLREAFAKQILEGRVKVLPARWGGGDQRLDPPQALLRPLSELLTLPTSVERWLWIDDRYCTGYGSANQTPIATTVEVLKLLEQLGDIDAPKRYALLLKLREAHALYVPIEIEELMHWLADAEVHDAKLVGSPALQVLRRSFNTFAAFIKDLRTQSGVHDHGRELELRGIIESLGLLRDGLQAVWERTTDTVELRVARSQWLWSALRLEVPLNADERQRARSLVLWRRILSQMVMLGAVLTWQDKDGSAARAYFDWLTDRVPALHNGSEPLLLDTVIADLRRVFTFDLLEGAERLAAAGVAHDHVRAFLGQVVRGLPAAIQERLYQDAHLMGLLAIRVQQTIEIGGLEVEPIAFFAAIESAARGEASTVQTARGEEYALEAALPRITLRGSSTVSFASREFELLSSDLSRRLAFLRSPFGRLDWHEPQDSSVIEALASRATGWDRVRGWAEGRDAAQSVRFQKFGEMMRAQERVTVGDLRPSSPLAYETYLALVLKDAQIDWEASATAALDRFGFCEALVRWAGLPVRLPTAFVSAYHTLDLEALRSLHTRAVGPGASLSYALRVWELSVHHAEPEISEHNEILTHLLSDWSDRAGDLITVLEWSARLFKRDVEWRNASAALRLAATWVHAERILGMMLEGGVPREQVSGFESLTEDGVIELLLLQSHIEEDKSAPRRLTAQFLLAYTLSAAAFGANGDPLASHRAEILARLLTDLPQGRLPSADLFQDRSEARDALGGYLGQELDAGLSAGLEIGDLQLGATASRDVIREQSLALFEQYPQDMISWAQLFSVGQEWLSESARRRIEAALDRIQQPKHESGGARALIMGMSKICPFFSAVARQKLAAKVQVWVTAFGKKYGAQAISEDETTEIHKDAVAVTEFVIGLARQPTRLECYQALSEWIPAFTVLWPALGAFWRSILRRASEDGTTEETQALWRAHVAVQRAP